jgi:GntR family transcriptional regulator, rspAB operon transcriptional repressor
LRVLVKPAAEKKVESDRVYALLRDSLLECEFRPGDFLSEVELARQCKTSRTPIREACNRLSQEGWISRIPHRGYAVKPISIREIVEIYEYRKLLECHAASATARNASEVQIARLHRIIAVEKKAHTRMNDILAANNNFHLALGEIAGNQRILDQLKLTLEYVHRLDILSTQKDAAWVPHGEILAAIEAHHSSQAGKAMASHIDSARDRMLKLFGT